jgi:hypothetical protein
MFRMKLFFLLLLLGLTGTVTSNAQEDGVLRMNEFRNPEKRTIIDIPNIEGYQTLKCDFHMHTMFSDGDVWPNVRVQEAWKEGLDVISITDHIEYLPHEEYVDINHNHAYELAKDMAARKNIVFIKGTEITRSTPPGHFNALFIGDASEYIEEYDNDKDKAAIMKATEQDAFIFWNHPGWKVNQVEGSYEWLDFVENLENENMLHGIEVINGFSLYKKALDWCVDKDLAVLGTSDIHNLVEHDYDLGGPVHRSMTLVFSKERTPGSIRDALDEGRTVAWASKYIAGKEKYVRKLFNACIEVSPSYHSQDDNNYYEIKNKSDLYFEMELKSGDGTRDITLYPQSSQVFTASNEQNKLTYEVITTYIRSDKHLVVDIELE